MNGILLNILIATLSGFLGAFILYAIQEYRKKRYKIFMKDIKDVKIINRNIIEMLSPGFSLVKSKSILGIPLIHKTSDFTIYDEKIKTNSYIFEFKNAYVKLTSKDNIQIDTITVLSKYKARNKIKFIPSLFDKLKPFGEIKLDSHLISLVNGHQSIRSMKESTCALTMFLPNPLYKYFTYFIEHSNKMEKYFVTNDLDDLLDSTIFGVCISNQEILAFYI